MRSFGKRFALYFFALLFLIFMGYPFLYMLSTSLKTQSEFFERPTALWGNYVFDNFKLVFELGIDKYFVNSLIVSAISVTLVILTAAMVSYPLARIRFKLNRPIYYLFLAGMMIPVHTTLIPVYILTRQVGLYDKLGSLIGPYVAFSLPISIIILAQFVKEIPKEMDEAAIVDGSSHGGLFWRVLFPLLTPAIATVGIYNFIHIWNEFVFGLILLTTPSKMTLPLGLRVFYGEFSVNIPGIMAAITIGTMPLLLVYFMAQEKVVRGLSAGAVKG